MSTETPCVLRDVQQRPLAIVGEVSPVIVVSDGAAGLVLGGGGFDAVRGVHTAGGHCTAVLLASHGAPPMAAYVDRRGSNVTIVESKGRFEAVAGANLPGIQPSRPWSDVQDAELIDLLTMHAAALRAHHVHVSSQAWSAWVSFARGAGWDHPLSASTTMRCSQAAVLGRDADASLPPLVFFEADCGREASACIAVTQTGNDRIIVHGSGVSQVELVVDGTTHVKLGSPERTTASDLAGFVLVGLQAGLCTEEALAVALRHPGDGVTPQATLRLTPEVRARRVTGLMPPHPAKDEAMVRPATAILVLHGDEILLGRKADGEGFVDGALYLPGGKLRPSEDFSDGAARELAEETGLTPGDLQVCGYSSYGHERGYYRFVQYVSHEDASAAVASDDLASLEWWPVSRLQRSDVFPLTWTQLRLLASAGAFDS